MKKQNISLFLFMLLVVSFPMRVFALEPVEGALTKEDFTAAWCNISSMTVG